MLTGCVQRLAFGHVNEATVRVLAAEGCSVTAPAAQGCCGALPLHAGHIEQARALAQAQHRGVRAGRASIASSSTPPAAGRR